MSLLQRLSYLLNEEFIFNHLDSWFSSILTLKGVMFLEPVVLQRGQWYQAPGQAPQENPVTLVMDGWDQGEIVYQPCKDCCLDSSLNHLQSLGLNPLELPVMMLFEVLICWQLAQRKRNNRTLQLYTVWCLHKKLESTWWSVGGVSHRGVRSERVDTLLLLLGRLNPVTLKPFIMYVLSCITLYMWYQFIVVVQPAPSPEVFRSNSRGSSIIL